ncbi:proteoglycan 4-like [Cynara cardunculus var. scolymus]|uniref:proteoglycan 4-like n=1 Tax=Cynara cardunculus var. scolymus TaxID=59895 RepID=UPI000D627770|nr:proteoglycan 4-like [Cynara cardunculus var. scolymus]
MAIIKKRARRREGGADSMPAVHTHEQTSVSEEEPIEAIPVRQVPFAKPTPAPFTKPQTQASVMVKPEPQTIPQYQSGPRMTRSRAKDLINFKPVKQPEGTVFDISDGSDLLPESPEAQTNTPEASQADNTSLTMLAEATTKMNKQSMPSTFTERLQEGLKVSVPLTRDLLSGFPVYPQASVGFIKRSVDEAIAASNEALGLRSERCTPTMSMVHSQSSMDVQTPKKGSSSLKQYVDAALAAMDKAIRREPECTTAPVQPTVPTTHAHPFFRNKPTEFNFLNPSHFTNIPISSSNIEPTLLKHASTSRTAPVGTVYKPTPVREMPNTSTIEPTPVTTTTSPLPSPNHPTTTPSTPTEPIPLPETVSIQELDFVLGLSPSNPSLTPFEHNEDPSDPQNTPVTQTPPPSTHSTQPNPNLPPSPVHSRTHNYYEGAPVHGSPKMENERDEVDTGASLKRKMPRRKRVTRMETRCTKRRREESDRSEEDDRAPRRRKRTEQEFEDVSGIYLKPKHLFSTPLARKTYFQYSEKWG